MNEAQKILIRKKEEIQYCIKNLSQDISLKQNAIERHKENLSDILEALHVLESEK